MNSVKLQDTKVIHRNLLHIYALTTSCHKEVFRKQSHLQPCQIEWKKPTQGCKRPVCKTLIKEIEGYINR